MTLQTKTRVRKITNNATGLITFIILMYMRVQAHTAAP